MSNNREFRILSVDAGGVKVNRKPRTRAEVIQLRQALAISKNMALDELMKQYLKEQAEKYERNKATYPQGYRVNRAPWK